jgi:hypothetical protein
VCSPCYALDRPGQRGLPRGAQKINARRAIKICAGPARSRTSALILLQFRLAKMFIRDNYQASSAARHRGFDCRVITRQLNAIPVPGWLAALVLAEGLTLVAQSIAFALLASLTDARHALWVWKPTVTLPLGVVGIVVALRVAASWRRTRVAKAP